MVVNLSHSDLGRVLLTHRGIQWIIGTMDDPYALLLRAASDDPHLLGQHIRSRGAFYRSSAEAWVTARHEVGAAGLRNPLLSPRQPDAPGGTAAPQDEDREPMPWEIPALREILPFDDVFLTLDRAEYDRLRRVTEPVIGAPALERHRTSIDDLHQRIIASLDGAFDVRTDFASVAATTVLSTLLGVPPGEHLRFAALCAGTASTLDATLCSPHLQTARELMASIATLREVLTGLVEAKRQAPGDDLVSALLRAAADEESPANDVLAVCTLLTVVGVEITTNLICEAMAALLDHPAQWARFRADPELAVSVVEETLRYAPPVRLQSLVAQEDMELAGTAIAAGSQVVVAVEAANRDPDAFADPDRFDIARGTTVEHLSLYGGLYTGLVAPAARLQAVLALRAIAATLPDIRRTDAVLRRLRSPVTGAVLRFPAATE